MATRRKPKRKGTSSKRNRVEAVAALKALANAGNALKKAQKELKTAQSAVTQAQRRLAKALAQPPGGAEDVGFP